MRGTLLVGASETFHAVGHEESGMGKDGCDAKLILKIGILGESGCLWYQNGNKNFH